MKQEHFLMFVVGLIILSYILDAIVNPLSIALPTPYHFFEPGTLFMYPFTTASILIKGIAFFITPLVLLTYFPFTSMLKGIILFILSGLMQLYALQDVATQSQVIPLEWSLSLCISGLFLLLPAIGYFLFGAGKKAHKTVTHDPYADVSTDKDDDL